jgi:hypothetical protein
VVVRKGWHIPANFVLRNPDDIGSRIFREVGTFLPDYTASHARRQIFIITAVRTTNTRSVPARNEPQVAIQARNVGGLTYCSTTREASNQWTV